MNPPQIARQPRELLAAVLLHPVMLFTLVWGGVLLLYSLHLSKLLLYSTDQVLKLIALLWLPLLATCIGYTILRSVTNTIVPSRAATSNGNLSRLDSRLSLCFRIWVGITIVEIIVSGGVPILWLVTGSAKTYFDFGIPSLHGLVNSLVTAIGLCRVGLYLKTNDRRHLRVPLFLVAWSLVTISRNFLLVGAVEVTVLYIALKGIRLGTLLRVAGAGLTFVLVFGIVGDLRSGAESFRELAQPSAHYPDWLPSGVLWVYIYITTPINNLIHTSLLVRPAYSFLFPNTAVSLFPSVLRTFIYGYDPSQSLSGDLVTDAFNVSTAYIGPVQDFGNYGMVGYSIFIGLICQISYFGKGLRGKLIYAVLAECLTLTLFFNHFFFLPVISQIFWIVLFFAPEVTLA